LFDLSKIGILVDKRGRNSRLGTVAGKFSIGELCVCAGGLDILKIDKNST